MASPTFVSGFGQYHTNEEGKTNRRKYNNITMAAISGMVDSPQTVDKSKGQWVIPSTLPSRVFSAQAADGEYWALWADLDKDPKPLDEVASTAATLSPGADFEIYTTRSAQQNKQKARIIIPLQTALSGAEWHLCQQILNDRLEAAGITPDRANEGYAQLCYLPNRGEFYDTRTKRNGIHFAPLTEWAKTIAAKQKAIERAAKEAKTRMEAAQLKREQRASAPNNGKVKPIDAFNDDFTVEEILLSNGYVQRGSDFRHPASESGSYSASVRDGRVYSLSQNDPLYTRDESNGSHDAFSVYTALEHGGNEKTAIDGAARILGLVRESPKMDFTELSSGASEQPKIDLPDLHRNAPKPDEAMLYGLIGDVGKAAAQTTEANRYAVAAGFMSFLSAAVGRDVYYLVGNTKHHARLFTLHVGRTARGRKGDAMSLVTRIRQVIEERHSQAGNLTDPFCGGHHFGGLSTREGLALLIHDGYMQGKDEVPAIDDKRLWVVESEFANVLHQAKRDGNTLSAALRDAWDGVGIRPATKTARLWASDPHISLSAAITPSELLGLMESRELSNGFANRFLIFWAERERIEPFPKPTHPSLVESFALRTMEVIRFAMGDYPSVANTRALELSTDARTEYARLYCGELSAVADGEKVTALLERRAPMLIRMASLFALTDLTLTIEVRHIHAALAWTRFHRDSVKFIFNDAAGEDAARESTDAARKILEYLKQNGQTSRSDLSQKCFTGHLAAKRLDEALDSLLMDSPPAIVMIESEQAGNRKRKKSYQLSTSANLAKLANLPTQQGIAHVDDVANLAKLAKQHPDETESTSPTSRTSQASESTATRAIGATSPISPNSHGVDNKQTVRGVL